MVPDWLGLLFFVVVPAAAAVGVHAIVRRIVPHDRLLPHHDVAGFLVAVVGVLYAVVLGFLVVTVWSNFNDVQNNADLEAYALGDAYGFAGGLPEPTRSQIRASLANYAYEVRDVEWKTLARGQYDEKARAMLISAIHELAVAPTPANAAFAPALRRETIVSNVLSSLHDVWDHRRVRLIESQQHIATALILAIVLGGLMVMAFVFLFGIDNAVLQLTMTGLVAGCIGLLFGVIIEFNQPYGGLIRVSPESWDYVITQNALPPPPR